MISIKKASPPETCGICPDCKEWTDAGDSCCGRGAFVEGGMVSDESAIEAQEYNRYIIKVLLPYWLADKLHSFLFKRQIYTMFYSHKSTRSKWSLWNLSYSIYFKKKDREYENEDNNGLDWKGDY